MSHEYATDATRDLLVTAENDRGTYAMVAEYARLVIDRAPTPLSDAVLGRMVRDRLRFVCEDAHVGRALTREEAAHQPDPRVLAGLYTSVDWNRVDPADVGAWARGLEQQ